MTKRLTWIGACALAGLLVAFAGMTSASTGQNNNNNAGGGANSNRGRNRGNSNANAGNMNGNTGGTSGNMNGGSTGNANSVHNANHSNLSSDQKFVNEAAVGGMAEVEMGRLGLERGTSDDVKTFSQRLIDDHTKANAELAQIAGTKGVMLPTGLDAKHQAVIDKLRGLSGAAFDREFAKVGVKDHQEDIKDFQKESTSGKDADIKAFATSTLPVLQDHLRMAQEAEAHLRGTKANANTSGMNSNTSSNMNMSSNINSNANSNRRKSRNSNSNGNSNAGANSNNSNNGNRR